MKKTLSEQQVERDISALRENTEQIKKLAQEVSSSDTDKMKREKAFGDNRTLRQKIAYVLAEMKFGKTDWEQPDKLQEIMVLVNSELQKAADRERVKVVEEIREKKSIFRSELWDYINDNFGHQKAEYHTKEIMKALNRFLSFIDTNTKKK